MDLYQELYHRFKANHGVVWLSGDEPARYATIAKKVAEDLARERKGRGGRPVHIVFHDKISDFYKNRPTATPVPKASLIKALSMAIAGPKEVDANYSDSSNPAPFNAEDDVIFVFHDVHEAIDATPHIVQQLRNIVNYDMASKSHGLAEGQHESEVRGKRMIVLTTPTQELSKHLPEIKPIIVPLPEMADMRQAVVEQFEVMDQAHRSDTSLGFALPEPDVLNRIGEACLGLTLKAAEDALAKAVVSCTELDDDNVRTLNIEKTLQQIEAEKAIAIAAIDGLRYYSKDELPQQLLPGYEALGNFIRSRMKISPERAKAHGIKQTLRGLSLAGGPGTGKTVVGMQTAMLTDRILLSLDLGQAQGRYVGDSEGNLQRILKVAHALRAVLLVDDCDKAGMGSAGGDTDGSSGVMQRMVMQLLTTMTSPDNVIMFVFTMNRVRNVPPELLRPGRIDKRFYAAMPNQATRASILRFHVNQWDMQLDDKTINKLAGMTERWSGAELNHVLIEEAAFEAMSRDTDQLEPDLLLSLAKNHQPFAQANADIAADISKMEEDCQNFVHVGNLPGTEKAAPKTRRTGKKPGRNIEH